MSFEEIEPIKEESPSPRKMPQKKLMKYMKKDRKEKVAHRREQLIHFVTKEMRLVGFRHLSSLNQIYLICHQR
jgi:hypothetical protein